MKPLPSALRLFIFFQAVGLMGNLNRSQAATPSITVRMIDPQTAQLSWTNTPGGFGLEEADALLPTNSWQPYIQGPTLQNNQFFVTVIVAQSTHRFFRLRQTSIGGLPPDPGTVASPLDTTVVTDFTTATAFLYSSGNPIQTGVTNGAIESRRAAVLRGKVLTGTGAPLSGVRITVLGHPEFGQTLSRADGAFDFAVNGGGQLTVRYEKDGFLAAQRAIVTPWRDYVWLPEVRMIPFDIAVTPVDLNAASMQVARGSAVSDADGTRRATILFPQGTSAGLIMPNGTTQNVSSLNIRATEYTVGTNGPAAMPANLPPSSGYTYCVELSADEAIAAGATEVRFSQPVPVYVENFLGFPVGGAVPAGYYDRQKGQWIASANGRVIKVLAISGGLASLDIDGTGNAANAAALNILGVTTEELARLAALYVAGQTLWRVPVAHFTPWDYNWPYGPPPDAIPPPSPTEQNPPVDDASEECGSVIDCENQSLGESVPVSGTSWELHYRSQRTPGRRDAYILSIPVSGAAPLPASLRTIRVDVNLAGRLYQMAFAPGPNLSYTVTWDGKDGFGRSLQGVQVAAVTVHYDYPPQYYEARVDATNSFARAEAQGAAISRSRDLSTVTLSKTWAMPVGSWDARAFGMGGWGLGIHHAYDPINQTLLLGNGRQRRAKALAGGSVIMTAAGSGACCFGGDGGPATQAQLIPSAVAVAPDGSVYVADQQRIRRVGPDGIITTIAGTGTAGYSGDGGPATAAELQLSGYNSSLAIGPDGSVYIADAGNQRVRRVGPDGIITTVAGTGLRGFSGDGGPATAATFRNPGRVAVGPDGSLYIIDNSNNRIRRVAPDGIITTVAGDGPPGGYSGDGGPAKDAKLFGPSGIAVGPDGAFYFSDTGNYRIRRVGPDGIITTVAGTGVDASGNDGGAATATPLRRVFGVALGADGSLYLVEELNGNRIRRIGPDGIITTVAGNGQEAASGDGAPATASSLFRPTDVAVAPDKTIYIIENTLRVRRVSTVLPVTFGTDLVVPSSDGREIHVFDSTGRHIKTLEALTGAARYQFGYGIDGYLTSVTDVSGNITTVERAGALATAIVAPGGHRTALAVNAAGWLLSATNPASQSHAMTYSADGLLQTFTDPRANVHLFTYDALGRLTRDDNPAGGSTTLARTDQSNGYTVTTTSSLGRVRAYQVEQLSTGSVRRTLTATSGAKTITLTNPDGSELTTYADGATLAVTYGPDPRWGMLVPVTSILIVRTLAGRTRTITTVRTRTLGEPTNLLSLTNLTDTVTDNGAVSTRVFSSNGAIRSITDTSASARSITVTLDALGRVTQAQALGLDPVAYTYDSRGLIVTITEGSGVNSRTNTLTYNAAYDFTGATDALGRTLSFAYDSAGRLVTATLPGARTVSLAYDASGNTTSLTPPGRTAHGFGYTPIDETASYTPPDLGSGTTTTQFTYNNDRALTRVTRPDGQLIDVTYDSAGRPGTVTIARGAIGYSYSPTTDLLTGISAPGGLGLSYTRDSQLLTGITWSGAVAGATAYIYNDDLRVTSESVNAANSVNFTYAADGLLSGAGGLVLTRNTQNGLLTGSTLGNVTDSHGYNSLAEHNSYSASYNATALYSAAYTRDALGRITQMIETIGGATTTFGYGYDAAGRLNAVNKDAVPVSSYSYDLNGNRTARTGPAVAATYDAQDRLTAHGGTTFSYTANGELLSKANGAQTTDYQYDALGNLLKVTLPSATVIDYLIDGQNRRIGKKVNGALVQGFLYQGALRPIAELDGANAVVSRFVYGTHINVPDYLIRGGVTYRIITDQLGSPRLVVDVATGTVAQRLDYDEFGQVLSDTNPGFQPFGFAGGLYDKDTKLVRFGVRDYDAEVGRWTAKDPIAFAGRDTNLYAYVGGDPANFIDSTGLRPVSVGGCVFVSSRNVRVLRNPSATSDSVMRGALQPGDEVRWLGYDRATGFDRVEVTLPGGGTVEGYVLRGDVSHRNLSSEPPSTEIPVGGKPMSSQVFPSHGAGTKG